jgi:hypothetical protein
LTCSLHVKQIFSFNSHFQAKIASFPRPYVPLSPSKRSCAVSSGFLLGAAFSFSQRGQLSLFLSASWAGRRSLSYQPRLNALRPFPALDLFLKISSINRKRRTDRFFCSPHGALISPNNQTPKTFTTEIFTPFSLCRGLESPRKAVIFLSLTELSGHDFKCNI